MIRQMVRVVALAVALTALAPIAARADSATYKLLPAKSKIVAHLLRGGAGARMAHDHVIQAGKLQGTIQLDPARPDAARISITVFTRYLRVDPPALRKAYGMKPLDRADIAKIRSHMQAIGQLYVASFPRVTFVSTSVKQIGKGRYRLKGKLTVRGVSRTVTLEIKARLEGKRLKGSGQLRFKQSWFGYKPYSAALGLVKVRDQATINIYLEAVPR